MKIKLNTEINQMKDTFIIMNESSREIKGNKRKKNTVSNTNSQSSSASDKNITR